MKKKREFLHLLLGFAGALVMLFGLVQFNRQLLMTLPLAVRMIAPVVLYWLVAAVPVGISVLSREKPAAFGFHQGQLARQLFTGIVLGGALSVIFTLIPHLLGLGGFVDDGSRYRHLWQFAYDLFYCVFAVGLVEEFLFRGFFYEKLQRLGGTVPAVILSSLLFGLFHLFTGNLLQMLCTALLGVLFCLCKQKLPHCTTLALALAHGVYDWLIAVFASLLL